MARIRREIVDGRLAPGDQLPTRKELEVQFDVSGVTLQRALDQLIRDGFVIARGSLGTFVSRRPPFLSNYGIVFPARPSEEQVNRFWMAIKSEAERNSLNAVASNSDQSIAQYMTIYHAEGSPKTDREFEQLVRHIRGHRLAGLIFLLPVEQYRGTPLLDTPGLPRVAISKTPIEGIPVQIELEELFEEALRYLSQHGRRRVALVSINNMIASAPTMQRWNELVVRHGMRTDPRWIQGLDNRCPQSARNLVHLLMHPGQQERPDSLLIADDNLVEFATTGLIDAGVRVPDDVEVVAHCNFPWPTPSVLPVKRLGYDVRECLRAAIAAIDAQRAGEPTAPVIRISARFEDEL